KDKKDKYDSRPGSVEVQLLADGEVYGDPVTLSDDNYWTHTWEELSVNDNGEPITYSVEELDIPEGYKSIVKDKNHGNIIVINDYTPEDPETPGTEEPDTPEDPETPGTEEPDTPETEDPGTPEDSETPETEDPGTPEDSETPETEDPGTPEDSETPETEDPGTPEDSETPETEDPGAPED